MAPCTRGLKQGRVTTLAQGLERPRSHRSARAQSEKRPLENRVWYAYPGQTDAFTEVDTARTCAVARVLD